MKRLLMTLILVNTSIAHAQDVYNFYFNKKNENQKTMIETGSGQGSPTVSVKNEDNTIVADTPVKNFEKKFKNWEFTLGVANTYSWDGEWNRAPSDANYDLENYYMAKGYSLNASKNFNRYFAGDLGISFLETTSSDDVEDFVNFKAGFAFTPIRINMIGHDLIEFGALFGMASFQQFTVKRSYMDDWEEGDIVDQVTMVRPYLGLRFAINFTEKIGIVTESIAYEEDKTEIVNNSFGLRYKF